MTCKYLARLGFGVKEHECIPFKFKFSTSHGPFPNNSFLKRRMYNANRKNHVHDFNIYKMCKQFGDHEIYIELSYVRY